MKKQREPIYVIAWLAVQFGINYISKITNFTQVRFVKLETLLAQLITNCTASYGITYTNQNLVFVDSHAKCVVI